MQLTKRETEVLLMLVEGMSNKEIARKLQISEFTVRDHVSAMLRKTGGKSRAALAAYRVHGDAMSIGVDFPLQL